MQSERAITLAPKLYQVLFETLEELGQYDESHKKDAESVRYSAKEIESHFPGRTVNHKLLWPLCLGMVGYVLSFKHTYGAVATHAHDLRVRAVYTIGGVVVGYLIAAIILLFPGMRNNSRMDS